MGKNYVRNHYSLAEDGKPGQETDEDFGGKEPPKTDFAEGATDQDPHTYNREKGDKG